MMVRRVWLWLSGVSGEALSAAIGVRHRLLHESAAGIVQVEPVGTRRSADDDVDLAHGLDGLPDAPVSGLHYEAVALAIGHRRPAFLGQFDHAVEDVAELERLALDRARLARCRLPDAGPDLAVARGIERPGQELGVAGDQSLGPGLGGNGRAEAGGVHGLKQGHESLSCDLANAVECLVERPPA